jgi:hypothetical protein
VKKRFFAVVITMSVLSGCVSTINSHRLDITITGMQKSQILPLKNGNDDLALSSIGAQVMEQSGFLDRTGQPYGYYAIAVKQSQNLVPFTWIVLYINSFTLYAPSLIGFPTDMEEFDITAYLCIFDSTGTMIKVYKKSDAFTQVAGLYYGQNPNKRASEYYSRLFKSIIEQVYIQSNEINYLLETVGPITNENMQAAQLKINEFFKNDGVSGY